MVTFFVHLCCLTGDVFPPWATKIFAHKLISRTCAVASLQIKTQGHVAPPAHNIVNPTLTRPKLVVFQPASPGPSLAECSVCCATLILTLTFTLIIILTLYPTLTSTATLTSP